MDLLKLLENLENATSDELYMAVGSLKSLKDNEKIDATTYYKSMYKLFERAVELDDLVFCEKYINQVDLNGLYCYLLDLDISYEMRELLKSHGAIDNPDYHSNEEFCYENMENEIIACSPSFQKQLFKDYLEYIGITEEKLIEIVESGLTDEEIEEKEGIEFIVSLEEDLIAIGVEIEDGKITLRDLVGDCVGDLNDIFDSLGYELCFDEEADGIGYYYY